MEFRKMRRFKQALTEKETLEILANGKTGILGFIGDYGYPHTVSVNYVYEKTVTNSRFIVLRIPPVIGFEQLL